jgi:hypothetical protein
LCAKTKRSRHEQDTRHQPLSLLRHLPRLIGKRCLTVDVAGDLHAESCALR